MTLDTEDKLWIAQTFEQTLSRILGKQSPTLPTNPGARLIALARIDPKASIEEAKRLSREDSIRRREEKKRMKGAN